ncbi:MAG: hypothetical protein U1G07_23885 [Verrucomicrobiota bacterium]
MTLKLERWKRTKGDSLYNAWQIIVFREARGLKDDKEQTKADDSPMIRLGIIAALYCPALAKDYEKVSTAQDQLHHARFEVLKRAKAIGPDLSAFGKEVEQQLHNPQEQAGQAIAAFKIRIATEAKKTTEHGKLVMFPESLLEIGGDLS